MVFFVQCHTGPGSYTVANSTLDKTKAFSFGSRHEPKVRSDTPAPNQYATEKCNFNRQPSFTFGERRNVEKKSDTPGKKNAQFHQSTENAQMHRINRSHDLKHFFMKFPSSWLLFTRKI